MNSFEKQVSEDPCTSFWLKKLVEETRNRDPVDTANDIEILLKILNERLSEPMHE